MPPPRNHSLRPFLPFLLRDLFFAGLMAACWMLDARLRYQSGVLAALVGLSAGLLTTLVAFFGHEWGHLLGTWLAGGRAHAPRRLSSVFLFFFDTRSGRQPFLAMSYGGYVASAVGLGAIALLVPSHATSGRVALLTAGLGVLVTFALEVPTTWRVARGGPLPTGGVFADDCGAPSAARSDPEAPRQAPGSQA